MRFEPSALPRARDKPCLHTPESTPAPPCHCVPTAPPCSRQAEHALYFASGRCQLSSADQKDGADERVRESLKGSTKNGLAVETFNQLEAGGLQPAHGRGEVFVFARLEHFSTKAEGRPNLGREEVN